MLAPYELGVAARYVRSHSRNRFISFISAISMLGIAVAVAVLIVVLSVMNGFESEVRGRILDVVSHGAISGLDGRLDDWQRLADIASNQPGVQAAAPFVDGQAMLVGAAGIRGVQLRGIDPQAEARASALAGLMTGGSLADLQPGAYRIVLGRLAAELLGVSIGDQVIVMVPEGVTTPAGVVPRMRRFTVAGIFNAGMYEFDRGLGLVNIADAQRLLRFGVEVSGVRLAVSDALQAPQLVRQVALDYGGGVYVTDWTMQHANFFRSIELTRSIIFVILLLVVGVAAFNIVSTLVMVVRDKQGEIAILRTVGASPRSIMGIFMLQGAIVGVVGTGVGIVAGVLAAWNVSDIALLIEHLLGLRFLAADVYFISELPSRLEWSDVWQIGSIAFGLSLLSTLYPAWRGALTAPAEVLRHE